MKTDHLIASIFLVAATACGSNNDDAANRANAPATTAPTTATETPTAPTPIAAPNNAPSAAPESDARALLTRVFRATQTRKMRMRATVTTRGGPHPGASTIVAETVPPNTKRVVMSGNGHAMQMIMSGQSTWMRNSDTAQWRRLPFAPQAGLSSTLPQMEERILAGIEHGQGSLERVGEETINGHACTIYHVTWTAPEMPGRGATPADGRVWVGNDGLVYKVTSTTQGAVPTTFEATYEYDESLTIELPN